MRRKIIFIFSSIILFVGCAPTSYYQLYKTDYKNIEQTDQNLIFENSDLKIIYNFWGETGNGDFFIYKKNEQFNIY